MTQDSRAIGLPTVLTQKPLQATKFGGILLTLVLGVAGFFRVIDAKAIIDGPLLGDGQFLALMVIPLISLGLVVVVCIEILRSGYRSLRADAPISEQLSERTGYVLLRGVEAGIAIIGVTLMMAALPVLVAESTPAPAGVGIMLLLMAVGVAILVASFVRSVAELFVYA